MYNNDLIKSKYFKYKEYHSQNIDGDLLSNVYGILGFDESNNEIRAALINWFEDCDKETFVINDDNKELFEFIDEEIVIKELKRREEKYKEEAEIYNKKMREEHLLKEKEKNNNFLLINPKYKRHTKVLLIGNYNKSYIDFTKKGDTFYIDDVKIINNEVLYSLRVVAPRKNRGIYVFRTQYGFKDEYLKIDETDDKLDYDYEVSDESCYIRKRGK